VLKKKAVKPLVKILKTPDNSFQVQKRISGAGFLLHRVFSDR
jgi:hypothetical protein